MLRKQKKFAYFYLKPILNICLEKNMIKLLSMDADTVIGMSIKGNVSTKDFELVANFIREVEIHHEFLRLYVEIKDVEGFSLETLFKEFEFTLTNFHRFEKQAIVIDKKFIQYLESISNILVASVEVQFFSFEDRCKARCWILS